MTDSVVRRVIVGMVLALCVVSTPVLASGAAGPPQPQHEYNAYTPAPAAMVFDALVVRPLSLVTTVAGAGLFIVSLPFSAIGHNSDAAAGALVGAPARYTFSRPLGDFDDGDDNN